MVESRSSWQRKLAKMKINARKQAQMAGLENAGEFRSGFEVQVASLLKFFNIPYEFEAEVIPFITEPKPHKYTPDFKIRTRSGKTIYIETKGRFERDDMEKHLLVRKQHPDKDVRLVFSNPHTWYRTAATKTYAKWATANGFKWCGRAQLKKQLKEWIDE